jgi:hypothetical protein
MLLTMAAIVIGCVLSGALGFFLSASWPDR